MLKWLLVVAVAVIVLGFLAPSLHKLGLGRLPGDLRFRFRGREFNLPIASTVLLSLTVILVSRLI